MSGLAHRVGGPYSHLSLSARKAKSGAQEISDTIRKSLSLVELPEEFEDKFSNQLFLTPRNRYSIETLAIFMGRTNAALYFAYDFIGFLLHNGDQFEDLLSREDGDQELVARIKAFFANRVTRMDAAFPSDGKLHKDVKATIQAHMQGSPVIRASKTKSGGKDIIVGGTPSATTDVASLGNFNVIQEVGSNRPISRSSSYYEEVRAKRYQSDLSLSAIRAANQIAKYVFGSEATVDNVFNSDYHQLQVNFDFEKIDDILISIHPSFSNIGVRLFRNLDKDAVKSLEPFWRIGVRAMPATQTVGTFIGMLKEDGTAQPDITSESLAVDVHPELAMIMALEPEIVDYISQGETELSVMCLYRWFDSWGSYYLRMRGSKKSGPSKRSMIPRYVTSATVLPKLTELRSQFGYAVTESRADENGLTAMPNGGLACLPTRDEIDQEMVARYENDLNGVMTDLFDQGIQLSTDTNTLRTNIYAAANRDVDFDSKIQERAHSLERYGNIAVGTDPDFDVIVTTSGSNGGTGVVPTYTVGSKQPSNIDVADLLGFDFAEPGEAPNFRSTSQVLGAMREATGNAVYRKEQEILTSAARDEQGYGRIISGFQEGKGDSAATITFKDQQGNIDIIRILAGACAAYDYFLESDLVPGVQELLNRARAQMPALTNLSDSEIESNLYQDLVSETFQWIPTNGPGTTLLRIFIRVLNDAAGYNGSRILAQLYRETNGEDPTEALRNHTHFFDLSADSKLGDIGRVYNYFGGSVLFEFAKAMADANRKELFSSLANSKEAPQANRLSLNILPFCTILARVVPEVTTYFASAEDTVEKLKQDTSITADDIKVPGLKSGVALMPHQVGAHQYLRQRPRNAVLFIAPGGGKTILGITDIAALMKELDELGEENLRPLVVCPNNLATTWADDLHKILDGWNCVPITTDTVNTWGEERMYDTLSKAPRNTLFVAGLSFISGLSMNVDVGGVRIQIRGSVEFINRFNFNYVLLDESHKVKNFKGNQVGSQVHFNTKKIFTAPSIKYARIATGTLVTDRVTDVVGQAALLSPTIFGDSLDVAEEGADSSIATITRTHSRLSNHTAFINYKRKHWAFMLPNPIDTFVPVDIDDPTVPNSELHLEVYTAMYAGLMEKLDEAASKARRQATSEEDESEDNDAVDTGLGLGADDDGDDEADVLGALLRGNVELSTYLQRMEQMLTDPMGDAICAETFRQAGVNEFTSAKVLAILKRIRTHFEVAKTYEPGPDPSKAPHQTFEWSPGVSCREYDIAVYQGQKYMARKKSDDYKRAQLPPSMTPPPDDPENWKLEKVGKLIVFCRYVRSVNAIYDALPENYKKVAVRYHGEVGKFGETRDANLDAFKFNDSVQIMIANEQAISEGHNMQMGSRIIRCDTPWSPGVYDQSTARIFRPDVSAASLDENGKPGDLPRELVFVDWVMTERTLEVGKVARLMWKTLEKVQFDEKGNELYEPLEQYQLEPIRMNAKLLLQKNTIDSLKEYFLAKRDLNDIEAREFADMRVSTVASMQPLTPAAPLSGFGLLEHVPFVANQRIPDRYNHGLVRLLDWCQDQAFTDPNSIRDALMRYPVVTEFGNGQIVGVKARTVECPITNKRILRTDSPVSTIRVRLAGTEELVTVPATKAHLATKITPAELEKFYRVNKPWATAKERDAANEAAATVEVETSMEDTSQSEADRELEEARKAAEVAKARADKRKQNQAEGRPINEGVEEAANQVRINQGLGDKPLSGTTTANPDLQPSTGPRVGGPKPKPSAPMEAGDIPAGGDNKLVITPTVYNGFLALYADAADPDAATLGGLKNLEFHKFDEYLYVDCMYYSDFDKIVGYLEGIDDFDTATERRLEFIQDGFETTGRMTFDVALASHLTGYLKMFFQVRHRTSNNRTSLKIYPMVLDDRLRLMIDLKSNPQVRKLKGLRVPGVRKFGTFEHSKGMYITFCPNKTKAKAKINAVLKAGIQITNKKEALAEITQIRLLPPQKIEG